MHAIPASDPAERAARSSDPDDDYVLALAERARAFVVTGDGHLLALANDFPIRSARDFQAGLDQPT
jgi:predicted nucleic acid-binding protein